MSQSYALTNLPNELRSVVGTYLNYRSAHARAMRPVYAVITMRTENSIERALDFRKLPFGWKRNCNRIAACQSVFCDVLWEFYLESRVPEHQYDPQSPTYLCQQLLPPSYRSTKSN